MASTTESDTTTSNSSSVANSIVGDAMEEHICAGAVIVRVPGGCPRSVLANVRTCVENGTVYRSVPIECVAGLPTEVLLLKRKKGHWDSPKGHVELQLGEEERACSLREMSEEAGIHPEDTAFVDGFCHKFTYRNANADHFKTVTWYLFLVLSESGETKHDHPALVVRHFIGCRWLSFDEARELAYHEHTKAILTLAEVYMQPRAAGSASSGAAAVAGVQVPAVTVTAPQDSSS